MRIYCIIKNNFFDYNDLFLEINPYGEMTFKDLESWYVRNGFIKIDKNYYQRKANMMLNKVINEDVEALNLILEERQNQVSQGYTPENDNNFKNDKLAIAGACFAVKNTEASVTKGDCEDAFPWRNHDDITHKYETASRKELLINAGAIILAELARFLRSEKN